MIVHWVKYPGTNAETLFDFASGCPSADTETLPFEETCSNDGARHTEKPEGDSRGIRNQKLTVTTAISYGTVLLGFIKLEFDAETGFRMDCLGSNLSLK